MTLQQWFLLIVPAAAAVGILGLIVATFRQEFRERDRAARQRAIEAEHQQRML